MAIWFTFIEILKKITYVYSHNSNIYIAYIFIATKIQNYYNITDNFVCWLKTSCRLQQLS